MAKKLLTAEEKKLTRNQKRNLNRRIKYALIRNITGDDLLAKKDRDLGWVKLKEKYGITDKPTQPPKLIPIKEFKKRKAIILPRNTVDDRKQTWKEWAKGDGDVSNFPFQIRRLAKFINKKNGFDDYAGYGFAVVWHAFVLDNSLDGAALQFYEQNLIPDKHDGDIYLPVMVF